MFSLSNFSSLDPFFSNNINTIPFYQKKNTYELEDTNSKFNSGGILLDDNLYGKCLLPNTQVKINNQKLSLDYFFHQVLGLKTDNLVKNEESEYPIQDLYYINSYDANFGQMVNQPIKAIFVQKIQESIKIIELEDGRTISSTQKHRFLKLIDSTRKIYEWISDIDVGDRIMTVDESNDYIIQFSLVSCIYDKSYSGLVYDLQIDKTHNFVAEGILCHNTSSPILSSTINPKKFFKFSKSKPKQEVHLIICASFRIPFWKQTYSHTKLLILNNKNQVAKIKKLDTNVNQIICSYNFLEIDTGEVKNKLFQNIKFSSSQIDFIAEELESKKNSSFWNQIKKIKSNLVWFIVNYYSNVTENYLLGDKLKEFFKLDIKNHIYLTDSSSKKKLKIKSIGLNFNEEEKTKYSGYIDKFNDIYQKNQIKFEDDSYLQKFCSYPQSNIKINYFSLDSTHCPDIYKDSAKLLNSLGGYQKEIRDKLDKIQNNLEQVECNICLQNINPQDLGIIDCGHMFCYSCLLKNQKYQNKCPHCRKEVNNSNFYLYIHCWQDSILAHQNIIQKCKDELNLGTKISNLLKLVLTLKKKIMIISNFEENLCYLKEILSQFKINSLVINNKNFGQVSQDSDKTYQVYLATYQFRFYKLPDNSNLRTVIFNEPNHRENDFNSMNVATLKGIFPKANFYQLYLRNSIEEPKIINSKIKVY